MLDWLKSRRQPNELPEYSELRSIPSRRLPSSLAQREADKSFDTQRETLEQELRQPPRRPSTVAPLFTELLVVDPRGVVTIPLPGNRGQCLLVFSTRFRAADYVQTVLASGPSVQYLLSSPLKLIGMLRDLEEMGIDSFALDRCPRCPVFTSTRSGSVKTADDLLVLWSISKATELTRLDLYFAYALDSARAGQLTIARDVALETVGHVSLEDPRSHLLLGQIAVELKDRTLLRQAQTFLHFLKHDRWEQKLVQVVQSGHPDFKVPE